MRKVDISRLMDAYEDTEFLPEEDMSVNTDKIKQGVANIVKGKRRTGRKLILLAAALAACLALAGWAWGGAGLSVHIRIHSVRWGKSSRGLDLGGSDRRSE